MDLISKKDSWDEISQHLSKYFAEDIQKEDLSKGIKNLMFTQKPGNILYIDSIDIQGYDSVGFIQPKDGQVYIVFENTVTEIPSGYVNLDGFSPLLGNFKINYVFKHNITELSNLTINYSFGTSRYSYHYFVPTGMVDDYIAKLGWENLPNKYELVTVGSDEF